MQVAICKVYETAKQDKIKGIKVPHDPHLTGKVQETRGPSRGGHAGREAAMWHITFVWHYGQTVFFNFFSSKFIYFYFSKLFWYVNIKIKILNIYIYIYIILIYLQIKNILKNNP